MATPPQQLSGSPASIEATPSTVTQGHTPGTATIREIQTSTHVPKRIDSTDSTGIIGAAFPEGHKPQGPGEQWMTSVRNGPATRGDMELLVEYLLTPPSPSRLNAPAQPLSTHFYDLRISEIMDTFYRRLQPAIFIPLSDEDASFLDPQDWHSKLLESEKALLDSIKRFILHTAIFCSNATDFAFPRFDNEKHLHPSRLEKVDCLKDFVEDVIDVAQFLESSGEKKTAAELPSIRDFIKERIGKLEEAAQGGRRRRRIYFFRPNSERTTHIYVRRIASVVLGLSFDYDQTQDFGQFGLSPETTLKVFDFDTLSTLLWKGFGLKFKDPRAEKMLEGMTGSMVDLDANFIAGGPFKFTHTGRPQEHLTLNREGKIRIYASKSLNSTAYMFQNHRIARAAGFSQLGLEICRSHALLFLQESHMTLRAQRIADQLNVDLSPLALVAQVTRVDFRAVFYDALELGNIPRFEDFLLLRPRLWELRNEMNDWRPQGLGDLFQRGYRDPLTWYGFWFATIVGTLGILSLGVSTAQLTQAILVAGG